MNNETINNISFVFNEILLSSKIRRMITVTLLITFAVPGLILFLTIFYYFIKLRKILLINCFNHRTILCILITNFSLIIIEFPFSFYQLIYGYIKSSNYCIYWIYLDIVLDRTTLFLTMYASIEYYFLIFHQQYFVKEKLIYYILLLFFCLFNFNVYLFLILFFPCIENYEYNLTDSICGGPCFLRNNFLKIFLTIFDIIFPCFILFIFNFIILFRFINLTRKISISSSSFINTIKKTRLMILQLLFISLISLIIYLPWAFIIIGQTIVCSTFGKNFIENIQCYLPYFTSFISPILALINLSEIRQRLKKILYI